MHVAKCGWFVAGVATLVLTAGGAAAAGAEADTPTFTEDVAPILYENCVTCHRAGEVAPMSLITYQETRPWVRSIKNKVMSGEMPPWHAAPSVGRFLNERRLTDAEREIIGEWVDAGAPEGDRAKLPSAPTFAAGWQIGTPDVIIEMPKTFDVPADGTIRYQTFVAPTNFTEDKWVKAVEVRAGTPAAVHHILAYGRAPDTEQRPPSFKLIPVGELAEAVAKAQAARAERAQQSGRPARRQGRGRGMLIGSLAPGTNPMVFEPETALRVPKDTQVVFQIHYTATGEAVTDRSSIGMVFADAPPEHELRFGQILNPFFQIPAGEGNQRVDALVEFTEDTEVYALFPHTHLRGKRWEYELVYPDGRREAVLSVPAYDFNWQIYYQFEEPLMVPKGARLEAAAWYDNSEANKSNPDPTVDVRWGEQTWEEMHYTGITYRVLSESNEQ